MSTSTYAQNTGPDGGTKLPFSLLSHGHGNSNNLSSLHGYAPLASYWAARGFGVLQPTRLDAKALGLVTPMMPRRRFTGGHGRRTCGASSTSST